MVLEACLQLGYDGGLLVKGAVEAGSWVSGTSPCVHVRKGTGNAAEGGEASCVCDPCKWKRQVSTCMAGTQKKKSELDLGTWEFWTRTWLFLSPGSRYSCLRESG